MAPEEEWKGKQKWYSPSYMVRELGPRACSYAAGLVILLLFGFSHWDSAAFANDATLLVKAVPVVETADSIRELESEVLAIAFRSSGIPFLSSSREMRHDHEELPVGEQYMWYAPHEGFSNQARELTNALKIAYLLNRTLVVPPTLDHFEVKQGKCLAPRQDQRSLRNLSWTAIASRFSSSSPSRIYLPIGDVLNLSSSRSVVKTIDLRVFLTLWCGIDISPTCSGPVCHLLAKDSRMKPWGTIEYCASKLSQTAPILPSPHGHRKGLSSYLVHEVEDNCRTTIWTHGENKNQASMLEQSLALSLDRDTHLPTYTDDSPLHIRRKDIVKTLGPGTMASKAVLLSFGSLFSRKYTMRDFKFGLPLGFRGINLMVDINAPEDDKMLGESLAAIQRQPFSEEILQAGAQYIKKYINGPFFCAHVRLEDGAFVGESTEEEKVFIPLRKKLREVLRYMNQGESLNIFVMTDRAPHRWNGTYLEELKLNPMYKTHTMYGKQDLVADTFQNMALRERGLSSGFLPKYARLAEMGNQKKGGWNPFKYINSDSKIKRQLPISVQTTISLCIEEVVCSCATLGFQGTSSSTITKNVMNLRQAQMCPILEKRK